MKFIADEMLGKLAKWLRIWGYDTAYFTGGGDDELVRRARAEHRVLLTRDNELTRRRNLNCLFIESDRVDEQIAQVFVALDLSMERQMARCPVCNTVLVNVSKEAAHAHVPAYVLQNHDEFQHCVSCDKYFWEGTHWEAMRVRLARLQAKITAAVDESANNLTSVVNMLYNAPTQDDSS